MAQVNAKRESTFYESFHLNESLIRLFGFISSMQPSSISIFFRDHHVVSLRRSELYTYTDFLAVCGGLFGLFLGVSALSVIEFIYFATLRLYWTLRQSKLANAVTPYDRETNLNIPIDFPNV